MSQKAAAPTLAQTGSRSVVVVSQSQATDSGVGTVRKALETIDIRVLNKPITLMQQRLYDVWLAFAQQYPQARRSGTEIFEFPLDKVIEATGQSSNYNRAHFDQTALSLMDLRVTYGEFFGDEGGKGGKSGGDERRVRSRKRIAGVQLVSFVEIDSSRNLMRVEFPEVIRKALLAPDRYWQLDLGVQRDLSSRTAITLYQVSRAFAQERGSPWLPWQEYSVFLSGDPEPHAQARDFVKVLSRAVPQVNATNTSHEIRVEFTKRGKQFDRMRVAVDLKRQGELDLQAGVAREVDQTILDLCAELRIPRDVLDQFLTAGVPHDYLKSQLLYCRGRSARRDQTPLTSTTAFFRASVQGNFSNYRGEAQAVAAHEPTQASLVESPLAAASSESDLGTPTPAQAPTQAFSELPVAEREQLTAAFLAEAPPTIRDRIKKAGFDGVVVKRSFSSWLRSRGYS